MPPPIHPAAVLAQIVDGTHVSSILRATLRIRLLRGGRYRASRAYLHFPAASEGVPSSL